MTISYDPLDMPSEHYVMALTLRAYDSRADTIDHLLPRLIDRDRKEFVKAALRHSSPLLPPQKIMTLVLRCTPEEIRKIHDAAAATSIYDEPPVDLVFGAIAMANGLTEQKLCQLIELINIVTMRYWNREENSGSGGNLHIFLEDGNADDHSFDFLVNHCLEKGDLEGVAVCAVWRLIPDYTRDPLLRLLEASARRRAGTRL